MSGCGGAKNDAPTFDGPVVPWTSSQPSELAERTPAATRCRAADLKVTGDKVAFEAYGNGGGIAVIALRNTGKQECRLEGTARVRLVKHGGPQQVNTALQRPPLIFPDTAYPLSSLLAVKPGEVAGLTVTWDNWCDPQIPGKKRTPPTAVRITLPNGTGHVDADYNAVPPCSDPKSPSHIGVSPFETAKVKAAPPWTSACGRGVRPGPAGPRQARRAAQVRRRAQEQLAVDGRLRPLPGVRPAARARGPGRGAQPQLRQSEADRTRQERGVRDGRFAFRRTHHWVGTASSGRSTPSAPSSRSSTRAPSSTAERRTAASTKRVEIHTPRASRFCCPGRPVHAEWPRWRGGYGCHRRLRVQRQSTTCIRLPLSGCRSAHEHLAREPHISDGPSTRRRVVVDAGASQIEAT